MNKNKLKKQKKRFRLYDAYRYAAVGEMSDVEGIVSYECNRDASVLAINFEDVTGEYKQGLQHIFYTRNEYELKEAIKVINKRLNNCLKPGPRRKS